MATTEMNCLASGGGGITEYEYKQVTWTGNQLLNIPTTKKAKGIIWYVVSSNQNYPFFALDGVSGNSVISETSKTTEPVVITFGSNSITSDAIWGSSNITMECFILY